VPPARDRSRTLGIALTVAGGVFLLTLPWQRQQWQETQRLRRETRLQQARLQSIQAQQSQHRDAQQRVEQTPDDVGAALEGAAAVIARGDQAGALAILRPLESRLKDVAILREDARLAGALAGLYERLGWIDRALVYSERGVRLAPESPEALIRLAFLEAALGWQTRAYRHAEAAAKRAPDAAEPYLVMALLRDQGGAATEAEKSLRSALARRPDDWHILLLLTRNLMAQRRYDDAQKTLDVGLKRAPAEPSLLSAHADLLLQRARNQAGDDRASLTKALEAIQRYQRLVPDSQEAHFLAGQALLALGDTGGALTEWRTIYAVRPDFPKLRASLGRLLVRLGKREEGQRIIRDGEIERRESSEYNRLVMDASTEKGGPEPHRQLARWAQAHGRLPRAILEWEQVLARVPGDAEAARERRRCIDARETAVQRPRR
jgi:tetratricopeptide (TPR) repeat protein